MVEAIRELKFPPDKPKKRGLRILENSPHKSQLQQIASCVRIDSSLDLQIRDGYLNIYYCGGSLLRISGFRGKSLSFKFDHEYFKRPGKESVVPPWLPKPDHNFSAWVSQLDKLKQTMREWFVENEKVERDLQQRICNATTRTSESSWIILDVEYAAWLYDAKKGRRLCRFDMIAVPRATLDATGSLPVFLVEFKQGNKALFGKSGVESHAKDLLQFITSEVDNTAREAFKCSVKNILREKIEIDLISGVKTSPQDREIVIKAVFLFHGSKISSELHERTRAILLDHGATPLFLESSQDSANFVEYIPE